MPGSELGMGASATIGVAPGRIDLLGGVADYAGALVLEVPTRVATTVTATPGDRFEVGGVSLYASELRALAALGDEEVRRELEDVPSWTRYPIGVAIVLLRDQVIAPPMVRLEVTSDVPIGMGVSSSAALEVATARALGADRRLDPLQLALLCQGAENRIVGAPCGIMDQVAVAVGTVGHVLPILCRPAAVEAGVALPAGTEVVGWPSGAGHDIAGKPYATARAASFMGRRIVEAASGSRWSWTSEVPAHLLAELPDEIDGATFLDRWGDTDDPLTVVEPEARYPVRAATTFGVEEHQRTNQAVELVRSGDPRELGALLAASHAGYAAMGLGHPATDAIVSDALDRPGVHAARASGGGSGGTVAVLCDTGALDDIEGIIR